MGSRFRKQTLRIFSAQRAYSIGFGSWFYFAVETDAGIARNAEWKLFLASPHFNITRSGGIVVAGILIVVLYGVFPLCQRKHASLVKGLTSCYCRCFVVVCRNYTAIAVGMGFCRAVCPLLDQCAGLCLSRQAKR